MLTKGFITVVQNSPQVNYLKHAYALALSLKRTQSNGCGLTIMVDDPAGVPDRYRWAFDSIVQIPWGDDAWDTTWKIKNKWKAIFVSPYEQTILVDADMLFTVDVSDWWALLERRNVWASTTPFTFRGDVSTGLRYREFFVQENLPLVYTALTYFDQSVFSYKVFNQYRIVLRDWALLRNHLFTGRVPDEISGDLGLAVALKTMNLVDQCTWDGVDFFGFVHMKTEMQGFAEGHKMDQNWTHHLNTVLKPDMTLLVGNYVQRKPFHYHVKSFLTDDLISQMEEIVRG